MFVVRRVELCVECGYSRPERACHFKFAGQSKASQSSVATPSHARAVAMTVGAGTSADDGPSTSKAAAAAGTRDPKNQPWIEKYRPQTLDEVAANKEIIDTIKRLTDENRLPHLLLYGPPGVRASACAALRCETLLLICLHCMRP